MLEREMEDLIANYPDEFFPGRDLKLKGRQGTFAGVGRFDLWFEDSFQTNILMELKAVPARYEVATQLAKYKDELRNRGEVNIQMWLVAPHVPHSVREFLDRIGIEYSEIHVAEFRRVADRHNFPIPEPASVRPTSPASEAARADKPRKKSRKEGIVLTSREFIRPAIHRLWDLQHDWVIRDQLIEEVLCQRWAVERLDADGVLGAEERRERAGNWIDWFSSNYYSGLHNLKDEFERIKLQGTWAYRPSAQASV